MTSPVQDIEIRRRRAAWRAAHRGTKELDILIGGFAEAKLAEMDEAALSHFEAFLTVPDPELQGWILGGDEPATEFAGLAGSVRRFHGLE